MWSVTTFSSTFAKQLKTCYKLGVVIPSEPTHNHELGAVWTQLAMFWRSDVEAPQIRKQNQRFRDEQLEKKSTAEAKTQAEVRMVFQVLLK